MKLLIIGGAGYLGTPLTQQFVTNRNPVICVDTLKYGKYKSIKDTISFNMEFSKKFNHGRSSEFQFIHDDVLNIDDHLSNLGGVDRILYLASPRLLELDDEDTVNEELNRLRWVIDKVKKEAQDNFIFYYFSSCSVYGRQDDFTKPFREDFPTQMTTKYSELKIKSEELIKKENEHRFKIFRLSTLYGNYKQQGAVESPFRKDVLINNLIDDIKTGKKLEIFDKDAKRPHLHISDAVEIIHNFVCSGFEGQILNIGFDENNKTKKEIVELIEKVIGKKLDVHYVDSKDSRNYQVDFSKMNEYKNKLFRVEDITNYENGIFDLWVDKINIATEEYDSILECPRPPMTSKSWYLKEEGKLSYPKTFGEWSIFSEDGDFLTKDNFRGAITPVDEPRYVNLLEYEKYSQWDSDFSENYIYLVPIYDPSFFEKNIKLGYSCVSKRYLTDARNGKCKIVFLLTLEGYTGGTENRDLEIISQWNEESNIPDSSVYYICGNLKIKELLKRKGLKFNGIPASVFDIWINPLMMPDEVCPFNPHETKMLYLSYNRNMNRNHRIGFCSRLLREDLLGIGKVSVGDFEMVTADTEAFPNADKLKEIVPIEIDRTLYYNLANDVSHDDYHQTFVSVVTESLADSDILFLSEKIWKPIYMGHPFIVLGNPGTLKYLKKLGFRTFSDWWDETYDDEQDLVKRTDKVIFLLKKLSEKNHEELIEVRKQMKDTLIKNREVFMKMVEHKYKFRQDEFNPQKYMIKLLSEIQNGII